MEIANYPNYLIYDDGRVYSKKRNIYLKPHPDVYGYPMVGLCRNDGKSHPKRIHRLVAEHYIANPYNKLTVDHGDGVKTNNHVDNLSWMTSVEQHYSFRPILKNNTTGHRGIRERKSRRKTWRYMREVRGKAYEKSFLTKTDALCYKYIFLLKLKAGLIG